MSGPTIDPRIVEKTKKEVGLKSLSHASIGEMRTLINEIEKKSDQKFIRMEMGVPGLVPPSIALEAEIDALKKGAAGVYPDFKGIPMLKQEIARFAKLFLDINVSPHCCIPTVGSVNGSYTAFMVSGRRDERRILSSSSIPVFLSTNNV